MLGIKTENGDIMVSNGALVIGTINEQIAEQILIANPGDFKEKPTLGMSIYSMSGGIVDEFFPSDLKKQIKTQHLEIKTLQISDTVIDIEV